MKGFLAIGLFIALVPPAQARVLYEVGDSQKPAKFADAELRSRIERNIGAQRKGFDAREHCWKLRQDGMDYCLRIFRADAIKAKDGERLYVMLGSGTQDFAHVTPGLHEAWVFDAQGKVIARSGLIPANGMGTPTEDWDLVAYGPNDYWGWMGSSGFSNMGQTSESFVMLAPRGNRIVPLGSLKKFAESTACDASGSPPCYQSDVKLRFVKSGKGKVYPIAATWNYRQAGKKTVTRAFTVPFDAGSWQYRAPKGFPGKDG